MTLFVSTENREVCHATARELLQEHRVEWMVPSFLVEAALARSPPSLCDGEHPVKITRDGIWRRHPVQSIDPPAARASDFLRVTSRLFSEVTALRCRVGLVAVSEIRD
jgi:hypothetical protein